MDFPAYESYKPSGVDWLGNIPEHWSLIKFRFLFSFGRGLGISKANLINKGIPCLNYGEIHSKFGFEVIPEKHELKCVPETYLTSGVKSLLGNGEFVFADTSEDIEGSGNFSYLNSDAPTFAGYHTIIARPTTNNLPRFLAYLFDSLLYRYQIRKSVSGVKVFSITQDILKNCHVWLPSVTEQTKIAEFLDYKTGQIDKLIEKKQKLIEKLQEKRIAVITQAVTKGLNPDVELKDSGIQWLGQIPKHWDIKQLKFCVDFLNNRRIPLSGEDRANMSKNFPYYGASGIIDQVESFIFDEPSILIAEDGANLLSRSTPLAFVATGKYWVNNHAHILKPISSLFDYWANLLCNVNYDPWITGSAQPKLTKDNLAKIYLPHPPESEQRKIQDYINVEIQKVDPLIKTCQKAIIQLKEYRTSLITSAVTGKIDVRTFAKPEGKR